MQLPRGTFREIRKGVAMEGLLRELDGEKFSGVANISSPSLTGTLVFRTGKCILVKIQTYRGDAAWNELQKVGTEEVDAALSLLGDAQIELALEFNKPFRLVKSAKSTPGPAARRPAAAPEPSREVQAPRPAVPVAPLKPPVKPAPSRHHIPAPPSTPQAPPAHAPPPHPSLFAKAASSVPPSPQMPSPGYEEKKKGGVEEVPEEEHEATSFESDLDTFDSMDFDNVTDKIRTDCKTMIKQLHLDHLMER
jgi:hypothetical protein